MADEIPFVVEMANRFRCIDIITDHAKAALTEKFVKELRLFLKNGTSDYRKDWFSDVIVQGFLSPSDQDHRRSQI